MKMNKKIIAVGAGHGGLVCCMLLAEQGYDVTVYEAKKRRDLGYDWGDSFPVSVFEEVGLPTPPKNKFTPSRPICYTNPNFTVKLHMPTASPENKSGNSVMERKYLINYLIRNAEKMGVNFKFDTRIICPITDGDRVLGVMTKKNGRMTPVFADLVIDAAGMSSPVRRLLPACFGIQNEVEPDQMFSTYRAFLAKKDNNEPAAEEPVGEATDEEKPNEDYTVHFFHMHRPGISWVINENDSYDVLIGRFGSELSDENIEESLADLRDKYPDMSDKVVRGGQTAKIPLRRTLPLIVADGYAAVGDSAAMTIPLIGSGIGNSMRAGKYLAEAVIADEEGKYTRETLWQYQYNYFTNVGNKLVIVDKLRALCSSLSGSDVDYLLEKEILTDNEISMALGGSAELSASMILQKVIKFIPKPYMAAGLTRTFARNGTMKRILSEMPEEYDAQKVKDWTEKYSLL